MHSWTSAAGSCALALILGSPGCSGTERIGRAELDVGCAAAVGTFNIRLDTAADGANAWPHRIEMVVDALGSAEIWGIQEALPHQVRELSRRLPHMHALWRTRDADPARDESCPIMFDSRLWALDPDEHGTFWLSEQPSVPGSRSWDSSLPRICTYARLVRRGGDPCALYVFNVHLDHRGAAARRESAQLLRQRIRARAHPDPVVLLGDFNAAPDSLPLQMLTAPDHGLLVDAWRAAHPGTPEQGTFNGWSAALTGPRIDFVLVSPDVRVVSASIDSTTKKGRWPSDHLPVTAQLQFRPATAAATMGTRPDPSPHREPRAGA